MKQRPILFSTEMVRAILDGRKTQTRRIVKEPFQEWMKTATNPEWFKGVLSQCPYGQVGNILWVREMLYQDGELGLKYVADNEWIDNESIPDNHNAYRNYSHCNIPSIHMPKWAARIFIEITALRVKRLNDISEEDAIAEGIQPLLCSGLQLAQHGRLYKHYTEHQEGIFGTGLRPIQSYATLWESIHGPGSWELNPWVWVVTFKRIEKP